MSGAGTITLAGTSLLRNATVTTGSVIVTGVLASNSAIANSLSVAAGASATFDRSSDSTEYLSLAGAGSLVKQGAGVVTFDHAAKSADFSGAITLTAGALAFNSSSGVQTLSGGISGSGSLRKTGAGTLTVSGVANSFSGAVSLTGGTTNVAFLANSGSNSSLGTGSGTPTLTLNGAVLVHTGSSNSSTNREITHANSGNNTINSTGAGTVSFTAANLLYTGAASARSLTLGGTNAGDNTFASAIGDSGTLTNITSVIKSGSGRWVLAGSNTYSGSTSVDVGTLAVGGASALGNTTGATTVAAGAVLDLNGQALGAESVTISGSGISSGGAVVNSSATSASFAGLLTLGANASIGGSGNFTLAGGLAGAFDLSKVGSGTVTLSGSSGHTGLVTVSAGTLRLANANALGTTAGATAVTSGAVLDLNGQAIGSEALTLDGSGLSSGGALLNSAGTAASFAGAVTLGSATTIGGSGEISLGGAVGGGFVLTKAGAGVLTFAGSASHTSTTVSSGTLRVTGSHASAATVASGAVLDGTGTAGAVTLQGGADLTAGVGGLGSLTLGDLSVDAGATVDLNVSGLTNYSTNAAFATGAITLGAGSTVNLKVSGFAIGDDFKLLSYTGSNPFTEGVNLILDHVGKSYRLTVNLDTATSGLIMYDVVGAKSFWNGAADANWQLAGSQNWTVGGNSDTYLAGDLVVFGAGAGNRNVILTGDVSPGSMEVEGADDYSFTTAGGFGIQGGGALAKSGSGKLTLATENSFSGGATLSAGRTVVGTDTALGSGTLVLSGGSLSASGSAARSLSNAVVLSANLTLGEATTDTGALTFTGATFSLEGAARTLEVAGNVVATIGGTVSNGGLVKDGAGDLALTGSNTYAGDTVVNAGRLRVGNNSALGTGSLTLAAGTALSASSSSSVSLANNLALGGDVTLGNGAQNGALTLSGTTDLGGGAVTLTTPSDVTLGGVVSNGGITKAGNGVLTLSGANTYTGDTLIRAGQVRVAGTSALGTSGTVTLNDASTGSANVALLVDASVVNGAISRNIVVANQGSGTVTLGAHSLRSGGTVTFSGSLDLGRDVTLTGGTVAGDRTDFSGAITGSGGVTIAGTNRVIFGSSAKTYAGTTTVASGAILQLSDGSATAASLLPDAPALVVNGTLNLAKGGNSETVGALSGSGSIQAISGADTLVASSAANSAFSGVIGGGAGTLAFTKSGAGTLTLTGANTYTAATTITAGTLQIGDGGATGDIGSVGATSTVTVDSGATLRFYRSGSLAYNASARMRKVAGAGTIVVEGTGVGGASAAHSLTFYNYPGSGTNYVDGNSWAGFSGNLLIKGGAEFQSIRNGASAMGTGTVTLGETGVSSGALTQFDGNWTWINNIVLAGPDNVIRNRSGGADRSVRLFGVLSGAGKLTFDDATGAMGNSDRGFMIATDSATSGDIVVNAILRVGALDNREQGNTDTALVFAAGSAGSLGTSKVTVNSGKILAFTRTNTHEVANLIAGAGKVHIGSASALDGGNTVNTTANNTYGQVVTLSNTNTYSGGTELLRGTLNIASLSNIGSGYLAVKGGTVANQTGVLNYSGGSASTNRVLWLDTGRATINVTAADAVLTFQDAGSGTLGGAGSTLFTKGGAGTLELGRAITSGGSTAVTVAGGRLRLLGANTYNGTTTVDSGTTLEIGGSGTLASSAIALAGTLEFASSATTSISALSGAGTLAKSGAGTLSLNSANANFSGVVTVSQGILSLGNAAALGTASSITVSGGSINLNGNTIATAITLAGGSLTGAANYAGPVTLGAGTSVTLSGADDLGSGDVTLSGGSLNLGGLALGRNITLAGGTLSNAANFTGAVTVTGNSTVGGTIGGTFGSGLSGTSHTTTLSGGAATFTGTLKGVGTLAGDVTVSGAHTPGNSPGVQTIDGDLTYTGTPSVTWELATASNALGAAGTAYDQIVVTGDLNISVATSLTLVFDGAGSDVDWTDAFWDSAHSWLVYDVAGATTSFGNLTITGATLTDDGKMANNTATDSNATALNSVRSEAGFILYQNGDDIRLYYRPVPEPSTYGLILGALALAGAAIRRRRKKD